MAEKIVVRWQAAQTLPPATGRKNQSIEDVTINIEHGVDFVGDPGMVWEIDGKQLVAKLVARRDGRRKKRSRYILTPEASPSPPRWETATSAGHSHRPE